MRLAAIVRQQNSHLTVSNIFRHPILSKQAAVTAMLDPAIAMEEYRPGSLLGVNNLPAFFDRHLSTQVAPPYEAYDVEDILPATGLQSSLIRGNNVMYSRLHLGNANVDRKRLETALHALLKKHGILLSVFASVRDAILQVVLRRISFNLITVVCDEALWDFSEKLCTQLAGTPVPLGCLHFQPFLVSRSSSEYMLIIRMTHAQFDGVSFHLLSKDLTSAYDGVPLNTIPSFADTGLCQETAPTQEMECLVKPMRKIPLPITPEGITLGTLVKAAWAITLVSAYHATQGCHIWSCDQRRDAPLPDIDVISEPCITISPFRVSLLNNNGNKTTAIDLLRHVQAQHTRSIRYANMDFRDIMRNPTSWKPDTDFGSILTHQNGNADLSGSIGSHTNTAQTASADGQLATAAASQWKTTDLGIQPHLYVVTWPVANEEKLVVQFAVSSHRLHPTHADHAFDALCRVIDELSSNPFSLVEL
ncbi:hypothetical protein F5Y16DRAFT_415380 [Xylariaceae sp. FL0255]|nr:hypothetical protein F5Y16DRAFT_415380 [Xylariaceae sp. FL0255]